MNSTNLKVRNYVIYGKKSETITPHFVHCDQIVKNHPGKQDGHVKPHLHSHLFQVIIIESGLAIFRSEHKEFRIDKPCIITIPENTLHEVIEKSEIKGRVITFSTKLLEELMAFHPEGLLIFDSILLLEQLDENCQSVFKISESIEQELLEDTKEKEMVLRAWLSLLLATILRFMSINTSAIISHGQSSHQYFKRFQKSIKQSSDANKSIKKYAAELQITPTHLNRICKEVIGKSASQVIQGYVLLAAKMQLKYSSQTISEISYLLNFSHPAYFSRFFKKHTNLSPKAYRASKIEMLTEKK